MENNAGKQEEEDTRIGFKVDSYLYSSAKGIYIEFYITTTLHSKL
jgi:hypothetical protein